MRLVVGLGNPGREYAKTRHNLGFMVLDAYGARVAATGGRMQFLGTTAEAVRGHEKLLLLKPQTYMNESGRSVAGAASFYRLEPEECLVICDCWHLPLGRLRVRREGTDGGHKGLRSVTEHLHDEAFPRLRIGIGTPPGDPVKYVLSPFGKDEWPEVEEAVEKACHAVDVWLDEGIEACMNEFNG